MGEIQMRTAQIFPPKDLVYFFDSMTDSIKRAVFFLAKKLSFFPILYQTPFKSAFIFLAKRLSFFFSMPYLAPLKPPLFSRRKTFLPKIDFESVQTFIVLFNTFAFSDYESSIVKCVCGTSSLMINYSSFILQSKKKKQTLKT